MATPGYQTVMPFITAAEWEMPVHIRDLSGLLYPRHCPFCDGLLRDDEPYLCRKCARKIHFISGPVCMKCGRPLEDAHAEYCDACRRREHLFIQGFAPMLYRGDEQASILKFKYGGRAEYAGFYARAIWSFGEERLKNWHPEAIIPVPVHPLRCCQRGYNQAQVTAAALAGLMGIPEIGYTVQRTRNTRPQKGLAPSDRRSNVRGAFHISEDITLPSTVLLVDDIYTTGATMDELASVVAAHGASRIYEVCITIAPGMT